MPYLLQKYFKIIMILFIIHCIPHTAVDAMTIMHKAN
jgi:hypothetical protein